MKVLFGALDLLFEVCYASAIEEVGDGRVKLERLRARPRVTEVGLEIGNARSAGLGRLAREAEHVPATVLCQPPGQGTTDHTGYSGDQCGAVPHELPARCRARTRGSRRKLHGILLQPAMATGLEGKVAVVSGGSRGIGRAIAMELAMRGCDCLLAAKTDSNLQAARRAISGASGRSIETVAADLRTSQGCVLVREASKRHFGGIDMLVNNAGATKGGDFLEQPDEIWEDGFALKFYACVRLCRLFWPSLVERGGFVVNIVGGFARTPDPDFLIGGAVNAAMANFTKGLAARGKRDGVNVNAVYPGLTETQRVLELFEERAARIGVSVNEVRARAMKKQGLRRLGTPRDVAKLVAFLCSADARHIQGTAIAVDGGATEDLH